MIEQITEGISVGVAVSWQNRQSDVGKHQFWFQYRITLQNLLAEPCQLLSRHWLIFDSVGMITEVEGEGVVGVQPILQQGEEYSYVSGVQLLSELGKMNGYYIFRNMKTAATFNVAIPVFELVYPAKLN